MPWRARAQSSFVRKTCATFPVITRKISTERRPAAASPWIQVIVRLLLGLRDFKATPGRVDTHDKPAGCQRARTARHPVPQTDIKGHGPHPKLIGDADDRPVRSSRSPVTMRHRWCEPQVDKRSSSGTRQRYPPSKAPSATGFCARERVSRNRGLLAWEGRK